MDPVDFTQWLIEELTGRLVPPVKRRKIYLSLLTRFDENHWDPFDCVGIDDAFDEALDDHTEDKPTEDLE